MQAPTPGKQRLSAAQRESLASSLPQNSPALKTLKSAGSRPVYYVTTDSGKQVLVAQLSSEDLAKAEASIKAHPSLMKGHDAHVLSHGPFEWRVLTERRPRVEILMEREWREVLQSCIQQKGSGAPERRYTDAAWDQLDVAIKDTKHPF